MGSDPNLQNGYPAEVIMVVLSPLRRAGLLPGMKA